MSDEQRYHYDMAKSDLPALHQPQILNPNTPLSNLAIYSAVGADGKPTNHHIVYNGADLDEQLNSAAKIGRDSNNPPYIAPRYYYSTNPNLGIPGISRAHKVWQGVELERALRAELGHSGPGPEEKLFLTRWNSFCRRTRGQQLNARRRVAQAASKVQLTIVSHPLSGMASTPIQRPNEACYIHTTCSSASVGTGTKTSPIEIVDTPVDSLCSPPSGSSCSSKTVTPKRKFSDTDLECEKLPSKRLA